MEQSKKEYYRVLKLCSQRWHEGKNEIIPWWNYLLGTLRSAYKEFERQIESVEARPAKSDLVRQTALGQVEPFALADMTAQLPAASSQLIKKAYEMKMAGQARLVGRGRGARLRGCLVRDSAAPRPAPARILSSLCRKFAAWPLMAVTALAWTATSLSTAL